ncbi:TerB family tellurite resistance protein [Pendulispora brunnea]|uniref:TerB family tellurite resistance protein n=1 Tax=Pendulispora brunnea TaxID=2905690 RepID=A0ABZ2KEG4_9BACT
MISVTEGLAGLRILVAVAKADGRLLAEERTALEEALEGVSLPDGVTLETLLEEETDVEAQIQRIVSPEARRQTYDAAVAIALVDGERVSQENAILDRMKAAFGYAASIVPPAPNAVVAAVPPPQERGGFLADLVSETKDTILPSNIKKVDDPKRRGAEIEEDVLKYSIMSAVLGAFPVPGVAIATDVAVVALQAKLVRDIGQYFGNTMDKKAVSSLLGGVVGGTGMRIAVNNLAKLVPGWGSVVGATTSFATTWAIGKVAERYFASGGTVPVAQLRKEFKDAKKDGKEAYDKNKESVEAKAIRTKLALEALNADLQAQRISQAEYDERVEKLA